MGKKNICASVAVPSLEFRVLGSKNVAAYARKAADELTEEENIMKTKYGAMTSVCGAIVAAVILVPAASACGALPATFSGPTQLLRAISNDALEGASAESLLRDQQAAAKGSPTSIVGMWKVTELSMGNMTHNPSIPDGTQLDFGYSQWHSDGTEFYNSGGFAPATQNYCLGVWAETGTNTYQVNHFALTYDLTGVYTGVINILETLTVSPGGTKYGGTFTINAYDTNGNQVNHLTEQVTGVRVTLDTTP
jgi:hypothetical protein